MQDLAVLKFGGTSVKNIARIQHVADVIANTTARKKIVVVSAMGDTTDYLWSLAKQCSAAPDKRELDMLLVTGEQVSIALLALTLKARGVGCKSFTGAQIGIQTDDRHSAARIVDIDKEKLHAATNEHEVVIVAGFQGLSDSGEITTLGRGGSDTTAVALAAAAQARECHIFTDVDGIFTSDPNKIAGAKMIECLAYDEVLSLARSGAQVLHPRSVELAKHYGIELFVRNTFKPKCSGTKITGEREVENYNRNCAVAVNDNQALLKVAGSNAANAVNDLIRQLEAHNVEFDVISQAHSDSTQETIVSIKYGLRDEAELLVAALANSIAIEADFDVSAISLIGSGLRYRPNVTTQLLGLLNRMNVRPRLISSGECRISLLVSKENAPRVAQCLHDAFAVSCQAAAIATPSRTRLQLTA